MSDLYTSIWCTCTENSTDIEKNTSNITVSLICSTSGWAYDNPNYWLTVNGSTVKSGTRNFDSGQTFTLASWTGDVPHNTDGTGTVIYQGYFLGTATPGGNTTTEYSKPLTTIPRASEILNGTTQRAIDGTISFSVDKKNANFVDKLTIYPTTKSSLATVVFPYTTGSTFTIGTATFNSIKALAPTTSYTSMVVKVETFTSSGAVVGTASSQFRGTFNVTAPTINPTWSASPTEEVVTGYDDVAVSLGTAAVADLGTTISAYEFTIGATTITATGYSVYFDTVEDNDVKVKIIDRRGLSTTISSSNLFDIIQYFKPTINATITRSPSLIDTGAILTFDGEYTWKNQDQEYNHPPTAEYKINNGNWTTISSFAPQGGNYDGGVTFASGTFDAAQEYNVYLRVYDGFDDNYSEKQLILSKAAVTFDMDLTNQRVGIGQPIPVATSGSNGLVSGGLIVSGKIKEEGQYLEDKYGAASNYNVLNNKPSINGVQLIGNKTFNELNIDIDNIKGKKLLWSNPSPDSAFNGQTIALSDNADNYDMLIFVSSYQGQVLTKSHSDFVFGGTSNATIVTYKDSTTNTSTDTTMAWRNVNISGVSVTINNAMYNSASSGGYNRNDLCIPTFIYGVNFNSVGSRITEGASGIVKLWERPSTSGVSTATYTLSDTADFYIIRSMYRNDGTDTSLNSTYSIALDGVRTSADVYATDGRFIEMRSYMISGTTFNVYQGYEHDSDGGSTALNDYCVPVSVYGVYVRQTIVKNYNYTYNLPNINDSNLIDLVYPVGAIYISVSPANPSTLFGGTWERIQDTFLLAAGSTYAAGATGGEAEHTLIEAEMPAHSHDVYSGWSENTGGSDAFRYQTWANQGKGWHSGFISTVGSGQAHNNMPPYLVVYMWQRTA